MANMGIRTAMACYRDDPTDTRYVGWKSEILKSLVWLMRETEANSLILAMEGKKCWRYEVFDQYKSHRKEEKAKAKMDFDTYYPMFDSFCSLLRQYMPNIYQIKVARAEGDDVVASLTKRLTPDYDVICVSTDRDFYQLLKYPGYRQFHPIKRKYVEVLNPERYLLEKVIVGDHKDINDKAQTIRRPEPPTPHRGARTGDTNMLFIWIAIAAVAIAAAAGIFVVRRRKDN